MPHRKTPKEFNNPGFDLDYQPYDAAKFSQIVKEVGFSAVRSSAQVREEWLSRMNNLAIHLKYDLENSSRPSRSGERAELESLTKATKKLVNLLPLQWDEDDVEIRNEREPIKPSSNEMRLRSNHRVSGHLERLLSPHLENEIENRPNDPDGILDELINTENPLDAREILILASVLTSFIAKASTAAIEALPIDPETRAPRPEHDFVIGLARLYPDIFGRDIGISNAKGKLGGPLVRFINAASACVKIDVTARKIQSWLTKDGLIGTSQ
ncbi:hypothetical protein [Litoreibacter janthinus]|uniref:Uncharacterized protein n=1 Tax=Litoreibacter janthinus TaxID=670154 RepID=A0A1I6FRY9_9RHOB|nr:hypothetical protein [Litoreibacter janthinus]SFR32715.1 hypothetical protein SAMN04488002_0187 [Litoreibacter janthinus]